ncbi:MAG TPA: hypothetical protein VJJ24_03140 [Candidatus Paceibacterota bacterium]
MTANNDTIKALVATFGSDVGAPLIALSWINRAEDYNEAEEFVDTILSGENVPPMLIDAVLEVFMATRENHYQYHGYWVHSLSHFTRKLWTRRQDSWIKRLNEIAFRGAIELNDSNCSDRLVTDFGRYAKWTDHPADFGLVPANLTWMKWTDYNRYTRLRIEAGRFESEGAYIRWELGQPETATAFDQEAQTMLFNSAGLRTRIARLEELGADTTEFNTLERDLAVKYLAGLEAKLAAGPRDWERPELEAAVDKTRSLLAALQQS